jgi:hypothetical protein
MQHFNRGFVFTTKEGELNKVFPAGLEIVCQLECASFAYKQNHCRTVISSPERCFTLLRRRVIFALVMEEIRLANCVVWLV